MGAQDGDLPDHGQTTSTAIVEILLVGIYVASRGPPPRLEPNPERERDDSAPRLGGAGREMRGTASGTRGAPKQPEGTLSNV